MPSTASNSEFRARGAMGPVRFGPQITNQGYDIHLSFCSAG